LPIAMGSDLRHRQQRKASRAWATGTMPTGGTMPRLQLAARPTTVGGQRYGPHIQSEEIG